MSNFTSFSAVSGGITGSAPSIFTASTSDSLATLLSSGYLNDIKAKVKQNDVIFVNYNDNSTYPLNTGEAANYARFRVSYASSNWSLQLSGETYQNYSQVSISSAQFLGMSASPVQLIAAPGANLQIVVNRMILQMTYNSAAYAAGGPVLAQYGSTALGAGVPATNTEAAADFYATASTSYVFNGSAGNSTQAPFSSTVNAGIYLSNQTTAFTSGNSPFVAKIYYNILPTVAT